MAELKLIYDDQEVELTGRIAHRKPKNDTNKRRKVQTKEAIKVEIKSTGMSSWTKWVDKNDLFIIQDDEITAQDLLDLQ